MNITINKDNNLIIINGHKDNKIECAKLTQICKDFKAIKLEKGYAEIPYSEECLEAINNINQELLFVPEEVYLSAAYIKAGSGSGTLSLEWKLIASGIQPETYDTVTPL